jgi:hypothetical protein
MNIRNLLRTIVRFNPRLHLRRRWHARYVDGIGVTVGPFLTQRSAERFARQATDSPATSDTWEAYRR